MGEWVLSFCFEVLMVMDVLLVKRMRIMYVYGLEWSQVLRTLRRDKVMAWSPEDVPR